MKRWIPFLVAAVTVVGGALYAQPDLSLSRGYVKPTDRGFMATWPDSGALLVHLDGPVCGGTCDCTFDGGLTADDAGVLVVGGSGMSVHGRLYIFDAGVVAGYGTANIMNGVVVADETNNWWAINENGTAPSSASILWDTAASAPLTSPLAFCCTGKNFHAHVNNSFPALLDDFSVVVSTRYWTGSMGTEQVVVDRYDAPGTPRPVLIGKTNTDHPFLLIADQGGTEHELIHSGIYDPNKFQFACFMYEHGGLSSLRFKGTTETWDGGAGGLWTGSFAWAIGQQPVFGTSTYFDSYGIFYTGKKIDDATCDRIGNAIQAGQSGL